MADNPLLHPYQSTVVDENGTVRCPHCGATSFTPQRDPLTKVLWLVFSLFAAPKLRCNGCGAFLTPN